MRPHAHIPRHTGRAFRARRVATTPHAFVLEGFSTAEERDAIIAAGKAVLRPVPRADGGDPDDERSGCEVSVA